MQIGERRGDRDMEELKAAYWRIRNHPKCCISTLREFWVRYGHQLELEEGCESCETIDYRSYLESGNLDAKSTFRSSSTPAITAATSSTGDRVLPVGDRNENGCRGTGGSGGKHINTLEYPAIKSAYEGMEPSFPADRFRFGKWWPNPGEPSHLMVIGKTGSGKSDLVQRLYRNRDFGETSFYYVTDKPLDEPPIRSMVDHTLKQRERWKYEDPTALSTYNRSSYGSNFKHAFVDTNRFSELFDLRSVRKHCDCEGVERRQHTVVVFDDDSYKRKLDLLKKGRSQGISCILVQQDWRGLPTDSQNRIQISGVWFVGPFTRNKEERVKYGSALGLNRSDLEELDIILKQPTTHAVFVSPHKDQFFLLKR